MAKHEIEANVPEGYEAVEYRSPRPGECYLDALGCAVICDRLHYGPWLILRKLPAKPKYRPFHDQEDFLKHYRGQWIIDSELGTRFEKAIGVNCERVSTENGWVNFHEQEEARFVEYIDGQRIETPFGVLLDEN